MCNVGKDCLADSGASGGIGESEGIVGWQNMPSCPAMLVKLQLLGMTPKAPCSVCPGH